MDFHKAIDIYQHPGKYTNEVDRLEAITAIGSMLNLHQLREAVEECLTCRYRLEEVIRRK